MSDHSLSFRISKRTPSEILEQSDNLAVEEPLQVVVDGRPLAVLMRTPGDDEVLVMGFLLTEGIISKANEVTRVDIEAKENHALVFLSDGHEMDWERLTRHLFSASSCGLCGKTTVEAILQNHPAITSDFQIDEDTLLEAPQTLRKAQETFQTTGGLHASGIFNQKGELLALYEDVGRHNALDKVIGYALSQKISPSECFLLVSGRISFELMQKSLAAGIPLVAGISAPSSLAVEFAQDSGQILIGFLRPPTFNIYQGAERILTSS